MISYSCKNPQKEINIGENINRFKKKGKLSTTLKKVFIVEKKKGSKLHSKSCNVNVEETGHLHSS
jgi:hypothetical protein